MNTIVKSLLEQTIAEPNVSGPFKNELRRILNAGDVLANAGSRQIPYFLISTVEGEEVERQQVASTTIREHANRAQRWSRLSHEWIYKDGQVVGAVSINEIAPIDR